MGRRQINQRTSVQHDLNTDSENKFKLFSDTSLKTHFFLLFFLCRFESNLAKTATGVCISHGGRFPRYEYEGLPPRKSPKGPNDLTSCRIFRKKTCCTSSQTHPILLSTRKLASGGEASQECLASWELLECSICDPFVGVLPGPPVICRSFCDSILQACSNAFFSVDPKTEVLTPCSSRDTLCGRGNEWASNGTDFCKLAGFSVKENSVGYTGFENSFCFDGKTILTSSDSMDEGSTTHRATRVDHAGLLHEFYAWLQRLSVIERISWAISIMGLTFAVLLMSKRRRHSYLQKQAALIRTKNMMEARMKQQSTLSASVIKRQKSGKKIKM